MKFKMLSVKELTDRMRETAGRFPLLVFFLCIGAVNHLYMSFDGTESFKYFSRNIFMSLLVLIPVLYSIRSLYESRSLGKKARFAIEMVSIIAAALYFYYLPKQTLIAFYLSQFSILFISSILLCLVCIKQGIGDDNFYWDFHAALFIRLIITGIYTLIILGGTSAALGATDSLFKTNLFRHHEIRILIVTLWLFAPLFFLAGVPNLSTEERVISYRPKWLESIGVYVMIPLTIVGYV